MAHAHGNGVQDKKGAPVRTHAEKGRDGPGKHSRARVRREGLRAWGSLEVKPLVGRGHVSGGLQRKLLRSLRIRSLPEGMCAWLGVTRLSYSREQMSLWGVTPCPHAYDLTACDSHTGVTYFTPGHMPQAHLAPHAWAPKTHGSESGRPTSLEL